MWSGNDISGIVDISTGKSDYSGIIIPNYNIPYEIRLKLSGGNDNIRYCISGAERLEDFTPVPKCNKEKSPEIYWSIYRHNEVIKSGHTESGQYYDRYTQSRNIGTVYLEKNKKYKINLKIKMLSSGAINFSPKIIVYASPIYLTDYAMKLLYADCASIIMLLFGFSLLIYSLKKYLTR
jgi:hypothetical protein